MCVGVSVEHPPGTSVRVDVEEAGTVRSSSLTDVPGQLAILLPSSTAQVLVDGVPWLSGPAGDDPLHAYGTGCPTTSPLSP